MNRRLVAYLGSAAASALLVLGMVTWDRGAPPGCNPPAKPRALAELTLKDRGVEVHGTAHYPVRLQMGTGSRGDAPVYVFPLFETGDTLGREVRVLVMTTAPPDPLLGYEDRTIRGLVRPAAGMVPEAARDALKLQGYKLSDDTLLIAAFDEE